MKSLKLQTYDFLAIGVLLAAVLLNLAFESGTGQDAQAASPDIAAVRVEIQRYMGYEMTPLRYLSLPYDATMNINEQVALLEIGFLVLMFLPVMVLLAFKSSSWARLVVVAASLLMLVTAGSNSFVLDAQNKQFKTDEKSLAEFLANNSFRDDPSSHLAARVYQMLEPMGSRLESMLSPLVVNDRDAVTYPILLLLTAVFSLLALAGIKRQATAAQGLYLFTFIYTFFWLLLSSGIVWYGFLALPLLWLCIVRFFSSPLDSHSETARRFGRHAFYAMTFVFVAMSMGQRFAGAKLGMISEDSMIGKRMYDPAHLKYICGDLDERQVIEAFYPGLTRALDEINRDRSALVYNVGTRFNFFVVENDRRIFKDNQLDYFNLMTKKYPTKSEFTAALHNAGVRFVMVDYYTPTADKTPEQSLVERYKNFMYLFYQNPRVELLATDRLVREDVNGQQQMVKGVFGDAAQFGHYAVFKIK